MKAGGQRGVQFKDSKRVPSAQVRALFRAAGWTEDVARCSPAQIQKMLRQSHRILTAWEEKKMVGFASAVSDGFLCGMVQNLVVHPRHRRRGIGTRLLSDLARRMARDGVPCLYVLGTRGRTARDFFHRVGFRPLDWRVFARLGR
ncbi:MAG: GNAT family N-acetyltransferase [Acidobacteria bacterium]|nr:GNAT family N-acetyltransferase [Acidobacteriota bacterium]